jgi:hypothetical protein
MNESTTGSGDGTSLSIGTILLVEHGGGYLSGDCDGKVSYQGMCRRRLWKWVSVFIGAPMGNLEEGSFAGDPEVCVKKGSGDGHHSS